jgi:hypothetical protein
MTVEQGTLHDGLIKRRERELNAKLALNLQGYVVAAGSGGGDCDCGPAIEELKARVQVLEQALSALVDYADSLDKKIDDVRKDATEGVYNIDGGNATGPFAARLRMIMKSIPRKK